MCCKGAGSALTSVAIQGNSYGVSPNTGERRAGILVMQIAESAPIASCGALRRAADSRPPGMRTKRKILPQKRCASASRTRQRQALRTSAPGARARWRSAMLTVRDWPADVMVMTRRVGRATRCRCRGRRAAAKTSADACARRRAGTCRMGAGSTRDSRHAPIARASIEPEMYRVNCVASWVSIASSYPGWTRPSKLLPGQALSSSGRPRLDYLARRNARVSVHVEQRRAGGAQRHRYLVHRPGVADRDLRHRRRVLAGAGVRAAVRRRRPVGADAGGAGLWRPPIHARLAGDVDRAMGIAVHDADVRVARPHGRVDFCTLRHPRGHAARSRWNTGFRACSADRSASRCGRCSVFSTASGGRPSRCG